MFKGTLPMLTKGPFALFYGGEEILDKLSDGLPGKGVPILILCSALFQLFLYVLKKFQARGMKLYTQNLRKSLVENILNMYGIIIIVAISSISLIYIIIHHKSNFRVVRMELRPGVGYIEWQAILQPAERAKSTRLAQMFLWPGNWTLDLGDLTTIQWKS